MVPFQSGGLGKGGKGKGNILIFGLDIYAPPTLKVAIFIYFLSR